MLKIATLASGSSGNCAVVSDGSTHLLIDAGISAKRIAGSLRDLGLTPQDLSAVLITHEHSDHIAGLRVLSQKAGAPIYATGPTCRALRRQNSCNIIPELLQEQEAGHAIQVGTLRVESFPTPHDAAGSVGYAVSGGGARLVFCTDLGHVAPDVLRAVEGCGLLLCEANHDEGWLKSGPYPYYLKRRILGELGHLSNEAGGALALHAVRHGARQVILGHLSQQNDTPGRAHEAVAEILEADGFRVGRDVALSVADRNGCRGWMEV